MAAKNVLAPPRKIMEMINDLSTVPEWIGELKKSACRQGVMSALALAKAYHPEMNPALLAGGFPELNTDDTEFTESDYLRCVRETRPAATKIANDLDLNKFQVGYNEGGKRMSMPDPQPVELLPPRKQTFASEVSTSTVITEDMVFEALSKIQWAAENPQTEESDAEDPEESGEPASVDPATNRTEVEQANVNPEDPTAGSS